MSKNTHFDSDLQPKIWIFGQNVDFWNNVHTTRCLKITEKVSFNIASKASYVYILSGQKFIKNAKKWSILTSF